LPNYNLSVVLLNISVMDDGVHNFLDQRAHCLVVRMPCPRVIYLPTRVRVRILYYLLERAERYPLLRPEVNPFLFVDIPSRERRTEIDMRSVRTLLTNTSSAVTLGLPRKPASFAPDHPATCDDLIFSHTSVSPPHDKLPVTKMRTPTTAPIRGPGNPSGRALPTRGPVNSRTPTAPIAPIVTPTASVTCVPLPIVHFSDTPPVGLAQTTVGTLTALVAGHQLTPTRVKSSTPSGAPHPSSRPAESSVTGDSPAAQVHSDKPCDPSRDSPPIGPRPRAGSCDSDDDAKTLARHLKRKHA
jgi:hypothetical protein